MGGEHVTNRGFAYVNSTPFNRRSFVSLLRGSLCGVGDKSTIALTAYDFHELLLPLCADFPLSLVEEAAEFADLADGNQHCFLGEPAPFGASQTLHVDNQSIEDMGNSISGLEKNDGQCSPQQYTPVVNLFVFCSLQRLVELYFVYAEAVTMVKNLFCSGHLEVEGTGDWRTHMITSSVVVAEIQRQSCSGALPEEYLPTEGALLQLLDGPTNRSLRVATGHACGAPISAATLAEVISRMADHFEMVLDPFEEELLGDVGEASLLDDAGDKSATVESAESSRAPLKGVVGSVDKRRQDKKARGK